MTIKTIYTSTPVNKQIALNYNEFNSYKDNSNEPVNYKIKINCSNSQKKLVKDDELVKIWKQNNPNSNIIKIVYNIEKEKNIRSETILSLKSNTDRLNEYIKINGINTDDSIYTLLQEIEDNCVIQYNKPKHSFTLLSVKIKGAIGLKKQFGDNEFSLNLEEFPQGIIAITGKYGSGKSTILENCQPYLKMLTRSGKLQNHFFLKESYRKLLYIDENNTYYSIEIFIDGQTKDKNGNKTGKIKSFVSIGKNKENLIPLEECNGNNDEFESWVNNNFGAVETFLRTSFFTRSKMNGVSDIIYTTKGEKKAFFSSLIGLDDLANISEIAKEKNKELDKTIQIKKSLYDNNQNCFNKNELLSNIKKDEESLKEINKQKKENNKLLDKYKKEIEKFNNSDLEILNKNLSDVELELTKLYENKDFIENYNLNKNLYSQILLLYKKEDKIQSEIQTTEIEFQKEENDFNNLELQIRKLEKQIEKHLSFEEMQKNSIPSSFNEFCPTCGQKMPQETTKKLKENIDKINSDINDSQNKRFSLEFKLSQLKDSCQNHNYHLLKDKKNILYKDLISVQENIKEQPVSKELIISYSEKMKLLPAVEEITKNIENLQLQKKEITEKLKSFNSNEITENKQKIIDTETVLDALEAEENKLLQELGGLRKSLDLAIQKEEENTKIEKEIQELTSLSENYAILIKAFGPNGILALELEAFSPEVSTLTNHILDICFGGEYKVYFQTLRTGSSGNLIEEFSVLVENTSNGNVRPLEWVSGGEGVIIKEALYNAFSIIRERSTGFSLKTKFMDEMDSSIDPATRPLYLKMINTVFEMENCNHVLLITHSSELKESIESKIEL